LGRAADGADQGGFSGIGHAEQPHVGEELQLELQAPVLALGAARELARRAVHARLEVQVAEPACAAAGDQHARAIAVEVGDRFARFEIAHDGAHRHAQLDVGRRSSVLVSAAAVLAVPRAVDARVAVVDQRVQVAVGERIEAAAAPAVAAVGAAARDVLFAPKAGHAIAALAGMDFDGGFVYEFHLWLSALSDQLSAWIEDRVLADSSMLVAVGCK